MSNHQSIAVKTELDLFNVKPTQTSIESGYYHECRPVSVLDGNSGPIEFVISPSDDYIDLSRMQIEVKVKITTEDGAALGAAHTVAPVNCFLSSLFEHVTVEINGKTITPPSNLYPYRSYLEKLINYSKDAKSTHLTSALFVQDEAGNMDSVEGSGFVKRKAFMKNGVIQMSDFIHTELCGQNKFLINGVGMRIKFYPSKNSFSLMKTSADQVNYKITFLEAVLVVRKARINPSVMIAHERALTKSNVKMPINRVDVKAITIPSHIQSKSLDNVYIGSMPKRVFVAMVSTSAFNSNPNLNPFNFKHYDHTHVSLSTDTNTSIRAIKSDFGKNLYLSSYLSLFTSTGVFFADDGNCITREDYPNGFAILGFDLTEDLSASANHLSLPRQGSLRLDLTFAKPLPEAITLLIYSEYDSMIEIDKERNVYIDYSS